MKILNEKPPEWIMTGCLNQFRVNINNTFWTYGDTIYNPGGIDLPDHIHAHEETHMRQQEAYRSDCNCCEKIHPLEECGHHHAHLSDCKAEIGKDAWWKRYLTDPRFRMEQEAEAYGAQYKFFCSHQKDRNVRDKFLNAITSSFAGPLYQLALDKSQARAMVLVLSGQKKLTQVT